MNDENYINLNKSDRKKYLYRIVSTQRLFEIFSSRRNVLVRPKLWEDPFENFVLKSRAQLPTGEIVKFGFHDDFYGQCWTLQQSSDAMWRIYSPDSKGVRIRTTVEQLSRSLSAGLKEWAHVQCFIGKVLYLSEPRMKKFGGTVFAHGLTPLALAKTLLVKRPAFGHEREVRLLYLERENEKPDNIFSYQIDPHNFIDQIMIDPRFSSDDAADLTNEIKKETGFKGSIKRSLLYAPPDDVLIPIG